MFGEELKNGTETLGVEKIPRAEILPSQCLFLPLIFWILSRVLYVNSL